MILKRHYFLAVLCYLAIPVVVIGSAAVGIVLVGLGLAPVLGLACCYLVLKSRDRSLGWLGLAIGGPLGLIVIAALKDLAPDPRDLYQAFIGRLGMIARAGFEVAFFVVTWVIAYQAIVIKREVMIRAQSAMTGRSVEDLVAEQLASSGMWAAGEFMETMYLVPLLYLLWPIVFNVAGRVYRST